MSTSAAASGGQAVYQNSGMLSRDQLLRLFDRFSFLTSHPDVKKRIAEAVIDKQEAVAVTTRIQEEILLEMGIAFKEKNACVPTMEFEDASECFDFYCLPISETADPKFGLACLGKVNAVYESNQDLMIQFYGFVAKEEMACEEAELGPKKFAERMSTQQDLQEQQLEMLQYMRNFHLDDQSAVLQKIRQQMEEANFEAEASILSVEKIQDIVKRRVTPVFQPR